MPFAADPAPGEELHDAAVSHAERVGEPRRDLCRGPERLPIQTRTQRHELLHPRHRRVDPGYLHLRPVRALHPLQRPGQRENVVAGKAELVRQCRSRLRRHLHLVRSDQERCPGRVDLFCGLLDRPRGPENLRGCLQPRRGNSVERGLVIAALLRRNVERAAVLLHGCGGGVDGVLVGTYGVALSEEDVRDPGQGLDELVVGLLRVLRRQRLRALGASEPVDLASSLAARLRDGVVTRGGVPAARCGLRTRRSDVEEPLLLLLVVVSQLPAALRDDRAGIGHDHVLGPRSFDCGVELPDDPVPHGALPSQSLGDRLDGVAHVLVVRDQVLLLRDRDELLRRGVSPLPARLSDDRRDGLHRRL